MAVNKVVYGNTTLMDITDSTVDENNLLAGEVAYKRNGQRVVGALNPVGNLALDDLTDVVITNPTIDQGITFDGTYWVNYGAKIILTYDDEFRGQTITCTQGQTVITKTAPSSGNSVTLYVPTTGNWTISAEYEGDTFYSDPNPVNIIALGTAVMAHISAITIPEGATVLPTDDIQTWLKCANITDKSYTTLTEVLADRETFETLIADSNACDYMARSTTWAEIKVPTMTDDTHPSGECFDDGHWSTMLPYCAFDGDENTTWLADANTLNNYIGYKFTRNVTINRVKIKYYTNYGLQTNLNLTIQVGNNKAGWETVDVATVIVKLNNVSESIIDISNPKEGDSIRIYDADGVKWYAGTNSFAFLITDLQFLGGVVNNQDAMSLIGKYDYCSNALLSNATWEEAIANSDYLDSVVQSLVPVMTSNTTPSGTVTASSAVGSSKTGDTYVPQNDYYDAFDGNNTSVVGHRGENTSNWWVAYEFSEEVFVNSFSMSAYTFNNAGTFTVYIQYLDATETWQNMGTAFTVVASNTYTFKLTSFVKAKKFRIYSPTLKTSGHALYVRTAQFYGRASSNVSNTNGIIHTANGDTVTCDGMTYTADTNGIIEIDFSDFDKGTYTFTSSIAKNPDNLSQDYTKQFRITKSPYGGTTELYLMPSNVLYWWGYNAVVASAVPYRPSDFGGNTATAPTITRNTNSMSIVEPSSAQGGVIWNNIDLSNASAVKALCSVASTSGYNGADLNVATTSTIIADKYAVSEKAILTTTEQVLSIDVTSIDDRRAIGLGVAFTTVTLKFLIAE